MTRLPMRALSLVALLWAAPLAAQYQVDTTGAGALIAEATDSSEVMENLRHLSDVIGPRLSGSPAMRAANDWVAERFRAYGATATLEAFDFGVTWQRGPIDVRLVQPFERPVTAYSWAWTEGTGGRTLTGPVVRANIPTRDSLEANRARIRGAWVMLSEPAPVWNPDGPPTTAAYSAARDQELERRRAAQRAAAADAPTPPRLRDGSSLPTATPS